MGRISTSVGLVSGFPIQETVDKLISLQARPRDLLVAATKKIDQQRTALTELTALLLGLQFYTNRLGTSSLYNQRRVTSSNDSLLSAALAGQPQLGQYAFTPLAQAQAQQLQSSRFASSTAPLGGGRFSFRFGGFVDPGAALDLLNGGAGVPRGKIRITDRSGASAEIDLSTARTVDDVLAAVNSATAVRVRLEARGDRFVLVDRTGQTAGDLQVDEVGGGSTAAALGFEGVYYQTNEAIGADVLQLFGEQKLDLLNDGRGVRLDRELADLKVTLRDGSEATIDFHRLPVVGTFARATTTAAGGPHAAIKITAVNAGAAYAGVQVSFVDDQAVTAGSETVSYDAAAKRLVFHIDAGQTTADQAIAALGRDSAVSALFRAERGAGGNGTGLVGVADSTTTAGPQSIAVTPGAADPAAKIVFTAVQGGPAFDGVAISFVGNPALTRGQESVAFDAAAKTLVFQIAQGQTTVDDVVRALNGDPLAGAVFTAARAESGNGNAVVSTADGVVTAGGAIIEPVAGTNEQTLADLLATINAAAPGKLRADFGPSNDGLLLTDLTNGGGAFAISNLNGSRAAEDLGLNTPAARGAITGRRLLGGLKTSLLSSLDGGRGLAGLGRIRLADRAGGATTIDLAAAETLDDVVAAINEVGIGVAARVNGARNGLVVVDTTGGSGNLVIANADGTNSAERLGLSVDANVSERASGNLHRQVVAENTLLAQLNGGAGVREGSLRITDTQGRSNTLVVGSRLATVGDLLAEIDRLNLAVGARINDAGDGIMLYDTAHGSGQLAIQDTGGNGTAQDLHLIGPVKTVDIAGQATQTIDGSTTYVVELAASETLADLVRKINDQSGAARAALFNDGSSVKPFRFTLTSGRTGAAGALLVDTTLAGLDLFESTAARDALLLVGAPEAGGFLASSSTNTFRDVLDGVTLTVKGTANSPVAVTVDATSDDVIGTLKSLVDNFNKVHDKLAALTKYDSTTNTAALLQGDGALLRINSDLSSLLSRRLLHAGSIQALEEIGLQLRQDGSLTLDETQLTAKLAAAPDAVKEFLSKPKGGLSDTFKKLLEQIVGENKSLLVHRTAALRRKLDVNNARVEFMGARLDAERQRLLRQFQFAELSIARSQSNLSAISSIQALTPLSGQIGIG